MGTPLLDPASLPDALGLARVVNALYGPSPRAEVVRSLVSLGGEPATAVVSPRAFPNPAWCAFDTQGQTVVASAGVTTVGDGLGVFAGSTLPPVPVGTWSAHSLSLVAARLIWDRLSSSRLGFSGSWLLCGHSYGGSIAAVLAALALDQFPTAQVSLATFGAPRPGGPGLAKRLGVVRVRRYMTSGDLVPRYPPRANEAPVLTLLVPTPLALSWKLYSQLGGGVVLYDNGALKIAPLPPTAPFTLEVQAGYRGFLRQSFGDSSHSMIEYQDRLTLAVERSTTRATVVTPSSLPEGQDGTGIGATGLRPGDVAVPPNERGGTAVMSVWIPTAYRAQAMNSGANVWQVLWMGNLVATGQSRSNAHTIAKRLNAYLRFQQQAAELDHGQWSDSWAKYLAVAPEASLGFMPPLKVV